MGDVILIVEKDDGVRLGIRQAFKAQQAPLYEVADPFDAMSALGRASFGAIVVSAGKRQLSLRGLCQLARKRHPEIEIFIITSPGVTTPQIEEALGVSHLHLVQAGTTTVDLAARVLEVLNAAALTRDQTHAQTNIVAGIDDSNEDTRPFARPITTAPNQFVPVLPALASKSPAIADPPVDAPVVSSGAIATGAVSLGEGQLTPAGGPAAMPLPIVRGQHSQLSSAPASTPLPPDEPLPMPNAVPIAAPPPTLPPEMQPNPGASTLDDVPVTAPLEEAGFPDVIPLAHDEPTATGFAYSLPSSPSSAEGGSESGAERDAERDAESPLPAVAAPSMSLADLEPGATERYQLGDASFSADHSSLEDVTMPMPVWTPPQPEPTPKSEAAVASLTSTLSSLPSVSDHEETMKMPAWTPPVPSPKPQPAPPTTTAGEALPAPIELPHPPPGVAAVVPSTGEGAKPESTVPETKLVGSLVDTSSSTSEGALLEGLLEDQPGAPLLMTLLAQEMTGVLEIPTGAAAGRLYFLNGEPVFAEHDDGDAGLLVYMQQLAIVPQTFRPVLDDGRAIPAGQLLSVFANRGLLSGEAVHNFLSSFVRARVLELVGQTTGAYRFFDDTTFIDTKPLSRVNSFGLILEACRKSTPPPELLSRVEELGWSYVHPRLALAPVAERLRPFVRGANLAQHITGQKRVKQLLALLGLDEIIGTLLILTLETAGLIELADDPMESFGVALSDSTIVQEGRFMLPDSEVEGSASADEKKAREEIFSLYMRLKPLQLPRDVLGVIDSAGPDAIAQAYRGRMSALDPALVPEGSARQLMVSRVEELRRKVQVAFESLTMTPRPLAPRPLAPRPLAPRPLAPRPLAPRPVAPPPGDAKEDPPW